MASIKKSPWDQYTDWVIKNLYGNIKSYFKQLPHLSDSIKDLVLTLVILLTYVAIIVFPLATLISLSSVFTGIYGLVSFFLLLVMSYGVIVSFKSIVNKTVRGWEYLIALVSLSIIYELFIMTVNLAFGYSSFTLINLIFNLVLMVAGLWLIVEIKDRFTGTPKKEKKDSK